MNFEDKLLQDFICYGIAFYKIIIDKDGNITREIIDPNDLNKQDYEQLEVVEYFKRKND